jgi:predicted nucleotidyltransferase
MSELRVFTPEERESLRDALVRAARADPRVIAAAHTGSAAVGRADRWSDIDLALRVSDSAVMDDVIADFTSLMSREHDAIAHLDIPRGNVLFRVFLVRNTLQVDLAFWPEGEFGATSPTFRLIFGATNQRPVTPPPSPVELIGMAWLYALHVRSSIARERLWQAEYMVSAMRDHVLALACVREGLTPRDARGVDDLPPNVSAPLRHALVGHLDTRELKRAFSHATIALLTETRHVDASLADRLAPTLDLLND